MREVILKELNKIEKEERVKILYCAESGSRAWGFASPDSDYDVRFIYLREPEYYLRIDKTRDVIEWKLDDVLDINGWDLKKALALLHNSNPTLFEWANSPIVYKESAEWKEVKALFPEYFLQKAGLYHYLSTAKSNYREYLKGEEVRLKKYFYVLRPLYATRWILKYGTPPPMEFSALHAEFSEESVRARVDELLRLKMHSSELGRGRRIDEINNYIEREIPALEEKLKALPASPKMAWEPLNALFLKLWKESKDD